MAVNFPDSPTNGDTTVINGATYTWDGVKWDTTSFASNVTATYDSPLNLPTTGLTNGDVAWVGGSTNKLYISNGTGWLSATLTNSAPVINSVQDASAGTTPFSLATDGTPTVITVDATDPESFGLTYTYSVTSGALGTTATVSQADNVFTITPGTTDPDDAGTFELTFSVYDGVNTVTSVAEFTLSFVVTITAYTTGSNWTANASNFVQETDTFTPPNNPSSSVEEAIDLSEDGTRLFVAGYNSGIRSFTLSTPYNVSTAVEDNKFLDVYGADRDTVPDIQNIRDLQISADGKRLWVHNTFGGIAQFTLNTAFDLTGGHTFDGSLGSGHTYCNGFSISWDGNYLYTSGTGSSAGSSRFVTIQLGAPFDITALGYSTVGDLNISAIDSQARGIRMNPTGTTAYLGFGVNDEIREYSLSTPHDISSGTYTNRFFDTTPATGNPGSFAMKSDGTKGWLVSSSGLITRFRTGL